MLNINSVYKAFDATVLENFSYSFPEKGLVLIRGASGSGKTTLLRLIAGLEKPDRGTLEIKTDRISCVFQEPRLIPHLTLLENVLLVKKSKEKEKARAILSRLGLEQAEKKFPHELSGGMKLRGAIARSLYYGGDIYLWDEPTKELDSENKKMILEQMQTLARTKLVIAVTHDQDLVSERVITL